MSDGPLRIGTLGAAKIAPAALVRPAGQVPEAEVVAVAARDSVRAAKFARKHAIPRVHDSYDALLADPEVDAVYNPLPGVGGSEFPAIRRTRTSSVPSCARSATARRP